MARRDKILRSFLEHEKIKSEYKISDKKLPETISEAIKSDEPIIRTVAMMVEALESSKNVNSNDLYKMVTSYLNLNATK